MLADAYKMLLKDYDQITIVPHGEMLEITTQPARLKMEI
jgi:hypothetical protein